MTDINWADAVWHKSTRSGAGPGDCVETAAVEDYVAVRDSKDPAGPILVFPRSAWSSFVDMIKADSISGHRLDG